MIESLQFITKGHPTLTHVDLCEMACKAGVKWVQYRNKLSSRHDFIREAEECREITANYGAKLIINDHLDIALNIGADGVHLGLLDMNTADAREKAGDQFIIGGTANTLEDILMHHRHGVDYVGVGPYQFTTTKEKLSPVLGLDGYKLLVGQLQEREIKLPVIAIGGITIEDVHALINAGVYGIAVSGEIADAEDMTHIVQELTKELQHGSIENWR